MADNLVWVKLKNGQHKQIAARIANDKNYQAQLGFKLLDGTQQAPTIDPQKKIAEKGETRKAAVETKPEAEKPNEELGAGVETVSLEEESANTNTASKAETVEEKITRLHKEGASAQDIKAVTGINMNTIKKVINKIK